MADFDELSTKASYYSLLNGPRNKVPQKSTVFVLQFNLSFKDLNATSKALPSECIISSPYPDARRVNQVDTYHGVEVSDPYSFVL